MNTNILTFKIGGQAGQGQQVAGLIFTKACARAGLYVFDHSEYPSRIRGGQVIYQVSISETPVFGAYKTANLLFALTEEILTEHAQNLSPDALIIYDSSAVKNVPAAAKSAKPIPLAELLAKNNLPKIAENMIAIGVCAAAVGFDLKFFKTAIADIFKNKGANVVAVNQKAAQVGFNYACEKLDIKKFPYKLKVKKSAPNRIVLTGNDAVSLGAVAAGCQLYVAYPMTPATSVLHTLAAWSKKTGLIVKQPEDEISAIHMLLGASWAGVRAFAGTSGGGFALMNEGLSLAGITEVSAVILMSQRAGPATGLPTWTEQGDLAYVCNAGHGEFLRVVLAPGDPTECFYLTAQAFNLAEIYQIPVIILLDKYLSSSNRSVENFDETKIKIDRGEMLTDAQLAKMKNFKRYAITKSGISPRSVPGQKNGLYCCNSDEHDESGFSIEGFQPDMRNRQVEKRAAKLANILRDLPKPQMFGPAGAKLTLIGWGSVKAPVFEALKYLDGVNYLHVPAPYPLSEKIMAEVLKKVKKLVSIENNYTSQFANLLREQTGVKVDERLTKYNGSQFFVEEVVELAKKLT